MSRTLIFALALLALGAGDRNDGIAWGPVDHGLRFGLAFGPASPDPQLRLVFQNVDRAQCLLPLGSTSAKGPVYDIEFRITSPAGKESPLFNFNGPPGIQPAAKPIVVEIAKGEKHEILLSEKKLIFLDNGKSRPLTEMLALHYSVRASVDTSGDARWTRTLSQWMGKVATGELRQQVLIR
jgi:hypothetical protein